MSFFNRQVVKFRENNVLQFTDQVSYFSNLSAGVNNSPSKYGNIAASKSERVDPKVMTYGRTMALRLRPEPLQPNLPISDLARCDQPGTF